DGAGADRNLLWLGKSGRGGPQSSAIFHGPRRSARDPHARFPVRAAKDAGIPVDEWVPAAGGLLASVKYGCAWAMGMAVARAEQAAAEILMPIRIIEHGGIKYAEIIRADARATKTRFFSPPESSFQFGLLAHEAGFVEEPHYHKPFPRQI